MSDYNPEQRMPVVWLVADRATTLHAPDLLEGHIAAVEASDQRVIIEDRVIFDPDRNLFVWAGTGAELTFDECEDLGRLDGTGRSVEPGGRHAVRALRHCDVQTAGAWPANTATTRYMIERAHGAYDVLGVERSDAILGPGGLSGATAEQLNRLIDDAAREEIRNHDARLAPTRSVSPWSSS